MYFISKYEEALGQRMGKNKCTYIWHDPSSKSELIERYMGFARGSWPFRYLGAPIAAGRGRISYFLPLVDKVRRRVMDGVLVP